MYHLKVEIPGLPKMNNRLFRRHWSSITKESKLWHDAIRMVTVGKRPKYPLKKAHVHLTRCSSRASDFDGLVSSFKFPIDGLVSSNILENDTVEVIGRPEYFWTKCKNNEGKIIIEVWDEESWEKDFKK